MADTRLGFDLDGATLTSGLEEYLQDGTDAGGIRLEKFDYDITDIDDATYWASYSGVTYAAGTATLTASGNWLGYLKSAAWTLAYDETITITFTTPTPAALSALGFYFDKNSAPAGSTNTLGGSLSSGAIVYTQQPHGGVYATSLGWSASSTYSARFRHRSDNTIAWSFDDGTEYILTAANQDNGGGAYDGSGYLSLFGYRLSATQDWTFTVTRQGYSSSSETATLTALTQAGTYKRSTLDIVAALNKSRLATSSVKVKVADNVDGAGWSAYSTVDAFRLLADASVTTSYQIRLEITGDGTELVEITSAVMDVTVPSVGTPPGQPTLSVLYEGVAGQVTYTGTDGSGATGSTIYYRKAAETAWSSTGASFPSGTISGLDAGEVYAFQAVSVDGTMPGKPSPQVMEYIGDSRLVAAVESLVAHFKASTISNVNDTSIVVARFGLARNTALPRIEVYPGSKRLTKLNQGKYQVDSNIQIAVTDIGGYTSDGSDIIKGQANFSGLPTLAEEVLAAIATWFPAVTIAHVDNATIQSEMASPPDRRGDMNFAEIITLPIRYFIPHGA